MSWDALFSLHGHGPYILGAYGVTAALMALEVALLWRRASARAKARRLLAGEHAGEARP